MVIPVQSLLVNTTAFDSVMSSWINVGYVLVFILDIY